jgi:hypothetical protein
MTIFTHLVSKHSNCLAGSLIVLIAVLISGCSTGQPGSASFANVIIPGKTPDQICQTTGAVFQEDGYQIVSLNPTGMVFQKEGSRGQSLAYGGVVDTHYGAVTLVRVKAELQNLGAKGYRLQCQAYMVRNAGDSFFAEETKLVNARSRPYQKLLDQVAKRLK